MKKNERNPEYQFTGDVKKQVESFTRHLQKQHLNANTIRTKTNYTGYFLTWLESQHLQLQHTRYNDLLNFVDHCRQQNKSTAHINRIIAAIRAYYNYRKQTSHGNLVNPAANLYLKGSRQKAVTGIIDYPDLENLYRKLPCQTLREKRNKVILGLLVYQGIATEELTKLEPGHVNPEKGHIYIPGKRKRNSRRLELKPFQILELHTYLTELRPRILAGITGPNKPGRKPDKINREKLENQLFVSINGSERIKNSLLHLLRDVQKINSKVTSAKQIRQSVITHWLKNHNLREVQYMAGHKYVSSTERYQQNNLDNLQSKLEKLHPLSYEASAK